MAAKATKLETSMILKYKDGYEIEDLVQIENMALFKAVFKYNCDYKRMY